MEEWGTIITTILPFFHSLLTKGKVKANCEPSLASMLRFFSGSRPMTSGSARVAGLLGYKKDKLRAPLPPQRSMVWI